MLLLVVVFVSRWGGVHSGVGGVGGAKTRVHDNVHDDMNMSLIMHDHSLFIAMINISSPMINSLS